MPTITHPNKSIANIINSMLQTIDIDIKCYKHTNSDLISEINGMNIEVFLGGEIAASEIFM